MTFIFKGLKMLVLLLKVHLKVEKKRNNKNTNGNQI